MGTCIISISREFGSGGRMIGKQLAAQLGIPCYDRTIIQKTAEKSGLSPEFIANAERNTHSRFHFHIPTIGTTTTVSAPQAPSVRQRAFIAQAQAIRELAAQGSCVIVGRCSDYILEEDPNCLKVFIHADMEERLRRCAEEYQLPEKDLRRRILETDRSRANYYGRYTGYRWGDMRRYDLTIDSGRVGVEGAVELIRHLVQLRCPELFAET